MEVLLSAVKASLLDMRPQNVQRSDPPRSMLSWMPSLTVTLTLQGAERLIEPTSDSQLTRAGLVRTLLRASINEILDLVIRHAGVEG